MKTQWKKLKPIISSAGGEGRQYLTVLDEEGTILLTNARMQKELNLKNPREVRSNFFNLLHPIHIEEFRNALQYAVKNNNPYSMEFFLKNGHYHPMKWQVSYLPGKKGDVKTFMCLGVFTEPNLFSGNYPNAGNRKAGSILQAFMRNTPNLAWVVNEDACLEFANPVFLQYFRLNETVLNKKIADLIPLSIVDTLYEKHEKVLQTGLPVEIVEKGKSADGTNTDFWINIFPIENAGGKRLLGGLATFKPEKDNTREKLDLANERINHLQRITSDAIWEWDMLTGEIIRNDKLGELIGYLPEDNKGLGWWLSRVHSEDRDRLNDKLKEVTDNGLQSWEIEYRFLCADGEYKNMHDRGYVIYEKGMPVKMIGSLSDITNEKLMENLLVEEKLRQYKNISEAVLRELEQERTRLGREMHDNVNQILSTIKLFVGLLTPANKEEEDIKQKTNEYTLLAIEEIRKLSREMVAPQMDGSALTDNIQNIIDDIELGAAIKVKFTHDNENELLSPGKKLTLFRIIQEQLKNIIKYSKASKIEIFLQSRDKYVQLVIKDNGVGFDTKKTSNGVGLSSIRDRAKFYNGKTEIQSAPGKGCQLTVSIPLLD